MKSKFLVLGLVTGAIGLGGCGIVHDYNEYELESPSDTTEIRHYKNICVNQRNGAACYYVYENGTYLSDEMRDKYLQAGCSLGYQKACYQSDKFGKDSYKEYRKNIDFITDNSKCYKDNDVNDCIRGAKDFHRETSLVMEKDIEYRVSELAYTKKGCELNNAALCYATYLIISNNNMDYNNKSEHSENSKITDSIMWKDYNYRRDLAKNSLYKACDLGFSSACEDLAQLKDNSEILGDKILWLKEKKYITDSMSHDDIRRFAEKACKLDNANCEMLRRINLDKAKYY